MEFMLIVNDDLIWVEGKNKTSPCTSQKSAARMFSENFAVTDARGLPVPRRYFLS